MGLILQLLEVRKGVPFTSVYAMNSELFLTVSFSSMQCCHVLVRHVRKGTFIQEVRKVVLFSPYIFLVIFILDICFLSWLLLMPFYLGSRAFVFFSSPVPKEFVNHIKCDTSVLPRIGALREVGHVFILFLKIFFWDIWY